MLYKRKPRPHAQTFGNFARRQICIADNADNLLFFQNIKSVLAAAFARFRRESLMPAGFFQQPADFRFRPARRFLPRQTDLADETARPAFVAADLLSQAEHGKDSQVVLVTPDIEFARKVSAEVDRQLSDLPRKEIAEGALSMSRIIVAKDLDDCVAISNRYAPEHLIVETRNARELVAGIRNAGSVFLGDWSTESAGDYASGTNHTLPTSGWAVSCSGVNLSAFMKKMTIQEITEEGLGTIGPVIEKMAMAEGLDAHANAVAVRLKKSDGRK